MTIIPRYTSIFWAWRETSVSICIKSHYGCEKKCSRSHYRTEFLTAKKLVVWLCAALVIHFLHSRFLSAAPLKRDQFQNGTGQSARTLARESPAARRIINYFAKICLFRSSHYYHMPNSARSQPSRREHAFEGIKAKAIDWAKCGEGLARKDYVRWCRCNPVFPG